MPKRSETRAKTQAEDTPVIAYVPLSDLLNNEAERNPKDHDIGEMVQSLRRFGFVMPGLQNAKTGRVVVGHGRARALEELKRANAAPPKRIMVRPEDGEWLVPVVHGVEFATDEEAEAYLLADNKLTERGGWDMPLLLEALTDLAGGGGLAGTGFDGDDLDELTAMLDTEFIQAGADTGFNNNLGQVEGGGRKGALSRVEIGDMMCSCPRCVVEAVRAYTAGFDTLSEPIENVLRAGLTALGVEVMETAEPDDESEQEDA